MNKDGIVILKGEDNFPVCLKEMRQSHLRAFLKKVEKAPTQYEFQDLPHLQTFCSLTLYQIRSIIVKSQDFLVLLDRDCKILSRKAGIPKCDSID